LLYHGDANGSSFIEANGFVFYFAELTITIAYNSLFYTYPHQSLRCDRKRLSNRIIIYWQLTIVMPLSTVGTDVVYVVSSLLTAVAFLCFPTYYIRCQQCVTAHT